MRGRLTLFSVHTTNRLSTSKICRFAQRVRREDEQIYRKRKRNHFPSPLSHGDWHNINNWCPEVTWIYFFVIVINALVGLPINVWVLWLIVRGSEGVLASEIFTLNLAALELIYCLQVPLALLNYFVLNSILSKTSLFFNGLIIFGRPLFQCCVCVERYLAVLHPLTFLRYRPLRYRVGCLALVWMITFGGCLAFVLLQLLVYYALVVFIILLLSVMSFCCLAVLRALRSPGPGEGEGQGPHLAKKRAFRIITVNLVFTLATYLPLIVAAFLYSHISDRSFLTVDGTCYSISVFCSFVQPLHFLSRAGKLQCIMGH
ncbi:hypothetical protein AAFF_G00293290 [Aldrovandia affinis]|uniref:G-protein coupled receptors family 1 profile domain-containing protein n=1 Tax=Aldrovandia affinis TaxID=143900 RepID=A0AAD7R9W5_9TELE|nr:hypothetical protein AAFF_G00293290 [Aldrovandia affinis]